MPTIKARRKAVDLRKLPAAQLEQLAGGAVAVKSLTDALVTGDVGGKKKRPRKRVEETHQINLFGFMDLAWFRNDLGELERVTDYLFAIPNGGSRNPAEAGKLRAQGVKAGVSDMMLPVPCGTFSGLWVELKADLKCKPTDLQSDWIDKMRRKRFKAEVAVGWKEASRLIAEYLGGLFTRGGLPLHLPQ